MFFTIWTNIFNEQYIKLIIMSYVITVMISHYYSDIAKTLTFMQTSIVFTEQNSPYILLAGLLTPLELMSIVI